MNQNFSARLGGRAGPAGLTSRGRNFALFNASESVERTGRAARILVDMTNF
jgi:hypothetical protein